MSPESFLRCSNLKTRPNSGCDTTEDSLSSNRVPNGRGEIPARVTFEGLPGTEGEEVFVAWHLIRPKEEESQQSRWRTVQQGPSKSASTTVLLVSFACVLQRYMIRTNRCHLVRQTPIKVSYHPRLCAMLQDCVAGSRTSWFQHCTYMLAEGSRTCNKQVLHQQGQRNCLKKSLQRIL